MHLVGQQNVESGTHLELKDARVLAVAERVGNGHHDLHAEEAGVLELEADLERVHECTRKEHNVRGVITVVSVCPIQ